MPTRKLKIARIGNSRGVRIPADSLKRYRIRDEVFMEERSDGILLKPVPTGVEKLSWSETAREMKAAGENWDDWDVVVGDGLANLPWLIPGESKVAEPKPGYDTAARRKRKRKP